MPCAGCDPGPGSRRQLRRLTLRKSPPAAGWFGQSLFPWAPEAIFSRGDKISPVIFSLLPKTGKMPKFLLYCPGKRCIISTLGIPPRL